MYSLPLPTTIVGYFLYPREARRASYSPRFAVLPDSSSLTRTSGGYTLLVV